MTEKTNKELTREVHQAVLGIPDTDDNGLVGVVKEIREYLIIQNGNIAKNRVEMNRNRLVLAALIAFLTGAGFLEGFHIIDLFG